MNVGIFEYPIDPNQTSGTYRGGTWTEALAAIVRVHPDAAVRWDVSGFELPEGSLVTVFVEKTNAMVEAYWPEDGGKLRLNGGQPIAWFMYSEDDDSGWQWRERARFLTWQATS